jgi:hypothetical protein
MVAVIPGAILLVGPTVQDTRGNGLAMAVRAISWDASGSFTVLGEDSWDNSTESSLSYVYLGTTISPDGQYGLAAYQTQTPVNTYPPVATQISQIVKIYRLNPFALIRTFTYPVAGSTFPFWGLLDGASGFIMTSAAGAMPYLYDGVTGLRQGSVYDSAGNFYMNPSFSPAGCMAYDIYGYTSGFLNSSGKVLFSEVGNWHLQYINGGYYGVGGSGTVPSVRVYNSDFTIAAQVSLPTGVMPGSTTTYQSAFSSGGRLELLADGLLYLTPRGELSTNPLVPVGVSLDSLTFGMPILLESNFGSYIMTHNFYIDGGGVNRGWPGPEALIHSAPYNTTAWMKFHDATGYTDWLSLPIGNLHFPAEGSYFHFTAPESTFAVWSKPLLNGNLLGSPGGLGRVFAGR